MNIIEELKERLRNEIETCDKRIARRKGPCYHDESGMVEFLNGRADAYEKVLNIIDELEGGQ